MPTAPAPREACVARYAPLPRPMLSAAQIDAYLARIGYQGARTLDAQTLGGLQQCHFYAVPYENLDILQGIELSLDPLAIFDKIVRRHRGGYCFELNALFGTLLRSLGFCVEDHLARFLLNAQADDTLPKRRHHVLGVRLAQGTFVADVGGTGLPLRAMQLLEGTPQTQEHGTYRFAQHPFLGWVLQDLHEGLWRDLYSFDETPQLPVDYTAIHYFCQHAPDSPFNKEAIVALKAPWGRVTIQGDALRIFRDGEEPRISTLTDDAQRTDALREHFGIVL